MLCGHCEGKLSASVRWKGAFVHCGWKSACAHVHCGTGCGFDRHEVSHLGICMRTLSGLMVVQGRSRCSKHNLLYSTLFAWIRLGLKRLVWRVSIHAK